MSAKVGLLTIEELAAKIRARSNPVQVEPEVETPELSPRRLSYEALEKLREAKQEFDPREFEASLIGLLHPDAQPLSVYEPLEFDDPTVMFETFNPRLKSSKWQTEECRRIAGYFDPQDPTKRYKISTADPLRYTLCAANGSGKDTYFITPVAIWFCATKIRTRCIITGAKYDQLKGQTWENIKTYAENINKQLGEEIFDIVEFYIACRKTGSEIRLFVTDDPGKAEGFHPFADCPTNELMFIANEAKSIPDEMFGAFSRFTTSHWLNVSTPDTINGFFFRSFIGSTIYPARHIPDSQQSENEQNATIGYARRISAYECPHKPKSWFRAMEKLHGVDSLYYRSAVLAEFTSIGDMIVITPESTRYVAPEWNTYGLPKRAGVDLSLSAGGDESVVSIWHGNKRIEQVTLHEESGTELVKKLIAIFSNHQLAAENIFCDPGGLGILIVQRLRESGWNVNIVRNEGRAANTKLYLNRVAENWFRLKRLIEEKILIIPKDDTRFLEQVTSRKYTYKKGKTALESKTDAKKRGQPSPDRADACVLAFAGIPMSVFLGEEVRTLEEQQEQEEIKELNAHWRINAITAPDIAKMQEIYAKKRNEYLDSRIEKKSKDMNNFTSPDKFCLTVNYKSHKTNGSNTNGKSDGWLNKGTSKYRSLFNR